jgi:aspartate carbamoyltransferase catalytic subunit
MTRADPQQAPPSPPPDWAVTSRELAALEFSQNVLDRRYALEAWLDARSNWLLSIQSILVGAVLIVATKASLDPLARAFVGTSLIAFSAGLAVSLYRSVPKFRSNRQLSGQGGFDEQNPRTTFGIETYEHDEYRDLLASLTVAQMVAHNADQIRQVNAIVMQELKLAVVPVMATAIGLPHGSQRRRGLPLVQRSPVTRSLIDIAGMEAVDVHRLLAMAHDGAQPQSIAGVTVLAAFFQQSTRTRLGFMSAATRQGASLIDLGPTDSLRMEPVDDQMLVISESADIVAIRHWDPTFPARLAALDRCAVVNAGSGWTSHPTQALIDVFTLQTATRRELESTRILFLGDDTLRAARSLEQLAGLLGIATQRFDPPLDPTGSTRRRYDELIDWADVVYIKPTGSVDYRSSNLNLGQVGDRFPVWVLERLLEADVYVMHALPRGAELPDALMRQPRCLAAKQVECGLAVRSAVLRWALQRD